MLGTRRAIDADDPVVIGDTLELWVEIGGATECYSSQVLGASRNGLTVTLPPGLAGSLGRRPAHSLRVVKKSANGVFNAFARAHSYANESGDVLRLTIFGDWNFEQRRWTKRISTSVEAEAVTVLHGAISTSSRAWLLNLSSTGAMLRCDVPVEIGWRLRARLRLSAFDPDGIEVEGEVVWVRSDMSPNSSWNLVGIRFSDLDDMGRASIRNYLRAR